MAKHRLIITEVTETSAVTAGTPAENKVFEQCFENLDVARLVREVNKPVRVRKQRESKPKA